MHDPSFSHRRARLGCRGGTFSPSRRQIRSTRLSLTSQPTAAELLPPAVVSHLAHPDRADRFRYALTLRGQNINLPQLGDDLFRLVAPPWHSGPPCEQNHSSGWTTSAGVDHDQTKGIPPLRPAKRCDRCDRCDSTFEKLP